MLGRLKDVSSSSALLLICCSQAAQAVQGTAMPFKKKYKSSLQISTKRFCSSGVKQSCRETSYWWSKPQLSINADLIK